MKSAGRQVRLAYQSSRLRRVDSAVSRSASNALKAYVRSDLTEAEEGRIAAIESARQRLLASDGLLSGDEVLAGQEAVLSLTVGDVAAIASKTPRDALLLFHLVRDWQPRSAIELGTCVGISAAYQGAAMAMNGSGQLVTLEGNESRARRAEQTLAGLGLANTRVVQGLFADSLPQLLPEIAPIDYAFIDGHHDEQATIQYFDQIRPHLADQAIVVFDDIRWSEGMKRAWRSVRQGPQASATVDLGSMGLIVFDRSAVGEPVSL